jgi:hypothetical protein
METVQALINPTHLRDVTLQSMESALRVVLTVATGTLALSVTFREPLIGNAAQVLWLLKTAWIALSLVPLVAAAHFVLRGMLFRELLASQMPIAEVDKPSDELIDRISHLLAAAFMVLVLAFVTGILAFTLFAVFNVT